MPRPRKNLEQERLLTAAAAAQELQRRHQEWAIYHYFDEVERRSRLPEPCMDPGPNPKQVLFHKSKAKKRVFCAGNRSGKTWCAAAETVAYALGIKGKADNNPRNIWICGWDATINQQILEPMMRRFLPLDMVANHNKTNNIYTLKNGSKITFKAYESGFEKFMSDSVDLIWLDEEPPDERIFKECTARVLDNAGDILLDFTPVRGMSWVYWSLIAKKKYPGVEIIRASIYDNQGNLPKGAIEDFEQGLNPQERAARIHGEIVSQTGCPLFGIDATAAQQENIQDGTTGDLIFDPGSTQVRFEPRSDGMWTIWEGPVVDMETEEYPLCSLGVDPCGGIPNPDYETDKAGLEVFKYHDGRAVQVAELNERLTPEQLAPEAEKVARYYHNTIVVPEVNKHCDVILTHLKQFYPRIYRRTVRDKQGGTSQKIGFYSSSGNKHALYDQLKLALATGQMVVRSARLLGQLQTYGVHDGDKYGAPTGMFDDLVTGSALAIEGLIGRLMGHQLRERRRMAAGQSEMSRMADELRRQKANRNLIGHENKVGVPRRDVGPSVPLSFVGTA